MRSLRLFVGLSLVLFGAACGGKNDGPKKIQPCGNGAIDQDEICDSAIPEGQPGACPTQCNAVLDPCVTVELQGTPGQCNAECIQIEPACGDADGCCPTSCTEDVDDDCAVPEACGNGVLDFGENCDPNIASGRQGACECETPNDACQTVTDIGDSAACILTCVTETVSACINSDGCCPAGCSISNDSDCDATCGDGVVGGSETCDGNCPSSCDDGEACTTDTLSGSASTCNATCNFQDITSCLDNDGCCAPGCDASNDNDCTGGFCGDGNVDPGELCDGNCPSSCDDSDACTTDTLSGSAGNCDASCSYTDITVCADGDGCCPPGCDASNDNDCSSSCGDGIIDPNETCDGNCPAPADCADGDACTTDAFVGSAAACTAMCTYNAITRCIDGDGCCAPGCNAANDSDCVAVCGNTIVEPGETCDGNCPTAGSCDDNDACTTDTFSGSAFNCTADCTNDAVTQCVDNDGCCAPGCTFDIDNDCMCIPQTCGDIGATCGTPDDGCGTPLDCSTCVAGETCVSNVCEDNLDVGATCTADADCNGGAGLCITEAELGWTGGYCTSGCVTDADCGPANHCGPDGLCLQNCTDNTDCRPDYECYDPDDDTVLECSPVGSGTGAIGDPCSSFADCGGGQAGYCGTELSGYLNGWCSQDCAVDGDCPAGSHCTLNGFCADTCAVTNDCRGSGYECYDVDDDARTECFRFANGAGAVGDACTGLWDCAGGEFGECALPVDGWPGGYCTVLCGGGEATCPNGTSCYDPTGDAFCLDNCQNANQCRAGYQCIDPGTGTTQCFP